MSAFPSYRDGGTGAKAPVLHTIGRRVPQSTVESGKVKSRSAYDGSFWTMAALACGVAVACVPIFSARADVSGIPQFAALAVVSLALFSLLRRVPKVHPAVLCYIGLVAMWAFTFESNEANAYYTYVKLAIFALSLHILIRTPRHVILLLGVYSIAALIGVLINWGEIRELRYAMETVDRGESGIRLDGTFSNPNRAGIFASMAVVSGLVVFFNMRHRVRWLLLAAGVGSGLLIGGLSGSRTGILGILLAGLAVPLMAVAGESGKVFQKAARATLAAGLAVLVAATTLMQMPQFERLTRLRDGTAVDGSAATRWGMAQAAIDVWLAHPIVGAGFRGYNKVSEFAGRPAHTAFGAVLADGGLIGFALFCTWYFLPGWHLLRFARRHPDRSMRRLAVGLLVFLGVFVVGSMFSHLHGSRDLIPLWAGICGFVQEQRFKRRINPGKVGTVATGRDNRAASVGS